MPLIQGIIDPSDKAYPEQYRRMAQALNAKARSTINFHLRVPTGLVALPFIVFNTLVGADTNLRIVSCYVTAVIGGAGGVNGTEIRINGGAAGVGGNANLDFFVLPVAATSTLVPQSTLLNYEIPGGNVFRVTVLSDDHVGQPQYLDFSFDALFL